MTALSGSAVRPPQLVPSGADLGIRDLGHLLVEIEGRQIRSPGRSWPGCCRRCCSTSIGLVGCIDRDVVGRYRQILNPDEADSLRFDQLAQQSDDLMLFGDSGRELDCFERALKLWRGRPFNDVADEETGCSGGQGAEARPWPPTCPPARRCWTASASSPDRNCNSCSSASSPKIRHPNSAA